MAQQIVEVWGKPYTIDVYQEPGRKTVWRAVGEYMGERLETQGRSETTAAQRWREAARYKGNL